MSDKRHMKLTVFTHDDPTKPAPGKSFSEDAQGKLTKFTNGGLTRSLVDVVELKDASDLAQRLNDSGPKTHLTSGILRSGTEAVAIPSEALQRALKDAVGAPRDPATGRQFVARSNYFLTHPVGPGLLCVDTDGAGADLDPDALLEELTDACPMLGRVEAVQTTSSGSLISGTKEQRGIGGLHLLGPVLDARDIPRALRVWHERLLLKGHARHRVSASGAFLARSSVDLALRVPSQPIFLRSAVQPPVTQDKMVRVVGSGKARLLDTRTALPDLTPAERQKLVTLLADAQEAMLDEMVAQRESYVEQNVTERIARGMNEEDALASVAAMLQADRLGPGTVLHFKKHGPVEIEKVLADPKKYHREACGDPIEPGYGSGSTAMFFATPNPCVHSFAHSGGDRGRVFRVSGALDFGLLDDLERRDGDGDGTSSLAPSAIASRMRLEDELKIEHMRKNAALGALLDAPRVAVGAEEVFE